MNLVASRVLPALLIVPALLLGQSRPSGPIPDEIRFLFFFLHLSTSETQAKGVPSPARRALQATVGLTDTEFSLLREVALSCKDSYDAKTRTGGDEVRALAAQNPRGKAPPAAVAARIDALERERNSVITGCMNSLKRGINAARYAQLENYVRVQGANIRYVDPSNPGPQRPLPPNLIPSGGNPNQGGLK